MRIIETIATGDELLNGMTTDTNSTWVAKKLYTSGRSLARTTVIRDDVLELHRMVQAAANRADLAIVFGGLGPTTDDLTAGGMADFLGCGLTSDEGALERIREVCRTRQIEMTDQMRKQAIYPSAATPLSNSVGLAVGFRARIQNCEFFFLPGVPREMKAMFDAHVLPLFKDDRPRFWHRTWSVFGLGEAQLQALVKPLEDGLPEGIRFGFRTEFPVNHLNVYVDLTLFDDMAAVDRLAQEIDTLLGERCYSRDSERMEEVVVRELRRAKKVIAFAESCTAGLAVHRLTRVPGTSEEVWGGFTVYQVDAKRRVLGVEVESPSDAVTAHASRQLAEKGLEKSGVDLCAGITGYMGPSLEGDPDPAGQVYIAIAEKGRGIVAEENRAFGRRDREELQWGSSTYLLDLVRRHLQSQH